jgi:hypothetical protein
LICLCLWRLQWVSLEWSILGLANVLPDRWWCRSRVFSFVEVFFWHCLKVDFLGTCWTTTLCCCAHWCIRLARCLVSNLAADIFLFIFGFVPAAYCDN